MAVVKLVVAMQGLLAIMKNVIDSSLIDQLHEDCNRVSKKVAAYLLSCS